MTRIIWLTDVHLNFAQTDDVTRFLLDVAKQDPDCVLLTGDIAEAPDCCRFLRDMANTWRCPIHFVLGNHDYYFSSIAKVRSEVKALVNESENLNYLTAAPPVPLTPGTGLTGHDGWADVRYGDYMRSHVMLHDYRLIEDLAGLNRLDREQKLHELGDQAAAEARPKLLAALEAYDKVYFITHVPPLLEACWHEGQISDPHWSPHFTCKSMGDMLLEVMRDHRHKQLTVLCGHTHGEGICEPLPNMVVHTGGAKYGKPAVVKAFDV